MLPNMVIVGAQKCGTTTLTGLLRRHPQVRMSRPKELHFFDWHFDRGLEWYAEQFRPRRPRQRRQHVVGEATPSYLYLEQARERLTRTLPEARLVAILRDPARRAYSHYWHERRLGNEPLETFEEALDREPERLAAGGRTRQRHSYVDRGHYLDQILPLVEAQGRERIHVMLLDDLVTDRDCALRGLADSLGIDAAPFTEVGEVWQNRSDDVSREGAARQERYPPMNPATRARLVEEYRESNARLAEWLGRALPSAWQV